MFNSLKCVKRLESVGVSRDQAETHIQIMSELMESNLVTGEQFKEGFFLLESRFKDGISALRNEMKEDISTLRSELKGDVSALRSDMKDVHHRIDHLESRLTIKMGTMMTVAMSVLFALLKLT